MGKLIIKSGLRFGRLVAIREGKTLRLPSGQTNRTIRCKCDCGKVKNIRLLHLIRGRTQSCGCIHPKHGYAKSKLYRVWTGIKERCFRDGHINSNRYKGRGIKMCDRWKNSFTSFKNWALQNGWKEGLQIDRINNNGHYTPSNCRFVTNIVNANNKESTILIFYNGKKTPIQFILKEKKISNHYRTIYGRLKRGWDGQEAIDTPIREGNYKRNFAA